MSNSHIRNGMQLKCVEPYLHHPARLHEGYLIKYR